MPRTPVYIVCSPRPDVGKTLLSRVLSEFMLLQNGSVLAFDINLREPSLLDFLPRTTETASIADTHSQIALMDRLIVNDGVAKVIDLGLHAFDDFFRLADEIGFMKEAIRRGVEPIVLFIPDATRTSATAWAMLRKTFPGMDLIAIDNEHVLHGETPKNFEGVKPLHIAALPAFLRSIVQRPNFSFTHYLRTAQDSSSELHQWTRANYTKFRNLEKRLKLHT